MSTTVQEHSDAPPAPETLVPYLLSRHPEARVVLDRHGLGGCGGRLGPYESIRFFARAHGVDEATLLGELRDAIDGHTPEAEPPAEPDPVGATIYRRFFLGALAVALTAGATWGAWLLWSIGLNGSFTGVGVHQVNAHGEAQIFGWVGLFIMGFAYQAFPRFWQTELAAPRDAARVFALMVLGLILRTVGMATSGAWPLALPLAMLGGAVQIVAVTTFAVQIAATFRHSGARLDTSAAFILAALGWFVVSTLYSVWHTWNTMAAGTAEALVGYVATYQAPLRDLQIHGLALFMIFGVSLRMLPALFNLPMVPERRAWTAFALLVAALLGEVGLFLAYRWTGNHALAATLMLPWSLLAVGSLTVLLPWRPWRPFPTGDRSAKFIRAAFGWLGVSLAMLLLLPLYLRVAGVPFSHAYYGAIRHAVTVGFVSLMILGMASRAVPTLVGVDSRRLSPLRGPFLLVNVGCFLRVSIQVLTDWHPGAFALIGLSGTLEVLGLVWWGVGLARLMLRPDSIAEPEVPRPVDPESAGRVQPGDLVGDVLDRFPESLDVFAEHGFEALRQPMLRRMFARQVTVGQAATLHGIRPDVLVHDLNNSIDKSRT